MIYKISGNYEAEFEIDRNAYSDDASGEIDLVLQDIQKKLKDLLEFEVGCHSSKQEIYLNDAKIES